MKSYFFCHLSPLPVFAPHASPLFLIRALAPPSIAHLVAAASCYLSPCHRFPCCSLSNHRKPPVFSAYCHYHRLLSPISSSPIADLLATYRPLLLLCASSLSPLACLPAAYLLATRLIAAACSLLLRTLPLPPLLVTHLPFAYIPVTARCPPSSLNTTTATASHRPFSCCLHSLYHMSPLFFSFAHYPGHYPFPCCLFLCTAATWLLSPVSSMHRRPFLAASSRMPSPGSRC